MAAVFNWSPCTGEGWCIHLLYLWGGMVHPSPIHCISGEGWCIHLLYLWGGMVHSPPISLEQGRANCITLTGILPPSSHYSESAARHNGGLYKKLGQSQWWSHPIKASLGLTYSVAWPKPYGNTALLPSSTPLILGGDWVPGPTSRGQMKIPWYKLVHGGSKSPVS